MVKAQVKIYLGIMMGILLICNGFGSITAEDPVLQEITTIGNVAVSADPDRMYRDAMEDAFRKAYKMANPSAISGSNNSGKDPVSIQQELGISRYQVLRYWQENDRFNIELKVVFGNTILEKSNDLSRIAKLNWSYQSEDQIVSIAKTKTAMAINTTQTIDVLDPDTGQRVQKFKIGLKTHEFYGDLYVVQEGDHLKVAKLTKYNLFKLVYIWRQKLPELSKFYLTRDILFVREKSGLIKALNWEDGSIKWQIIANSQSDIVEIAYNRYMIVFPNEDLWLVNESGVKIWATKFEAGLLAKPIYGANQIFCLLKNGELKTVDRDTGKVISTWNVKNQPHNRNIKLELSEKELYIIYNEANQGYLQAYHRLTGKQLWEVSWDQAVLGSLVKIADTIIIGRGNSFEARDPIFGMKLWDEPTYGQITNICTVDDKLFVTAGNRVYCYDFK